MTVANPYFIHLELFWPNGTRPNQNEIARVNAYDVNGSVVTWEGQSGYDPNTGGWFDIFMQNIPAFEPRLHPNLRFEVENVQNQVVHTTQIFNAIVSESTVKIVIGESDMLVGQWVVSGTISNADTSPVTVGTVQVCDVTNGSQVLISSTTPDGSGNYSASFALDAFEDNGEAHQNPNVQVKYLNENGELVAQSAIQTLMTQQGTIHLVIGSVAQDGDYRVFGTVRNQLGLGVSQVLVEAYHLAWTTSGIQEVLLGKTMSGPSGGYEIRYTPPANLAGASECDTDPGVVNLLVYAKEGTIVAPGGELTRGPLISPAPVSQRVDLFVDKVALVSGSAYQRVHDALASCLGGTEEIQLTTLESLLAREDYFAFVAKASNTSPTELRAYAQARVISARINNDIDWTAGVYAPFSDLDPAVIFALVRRGLGTSLEQLLEVDPNRFFQAIVASVAAGIIDSSFETRLSDEAAEPLQAQWGLILGFYLGTSSLLWQNQLLSLVINTTTEGPSPAPEDKRAEVTRLYYEHQGTFEEFIESLPSSLVSDTQKKELLFVFEMYEAVDQYFPIVARTFIYRTPLELDELSDLANVTLDDRPDGSPGWRRLVIEQEDVSLGFPGDVPGRTFDEKVEVYAQRLLNLFGEAAPEKRFVTEGLQSASGGSDPDLTAALEFLRDQEEFVLTSTVVDKFIADNGLTVAPATVSKLKQLQRVSRLTQDYEVAASLIDIGFDSAVKIAQVEQGQFIADAEEALGSITIARSVHVRASHYAAEVFSNLVRFNQNLNDLGGITVIPPGANLQTLGESGEAGKFPNWATLFGALNACHSEHCQTVLSPGAYLMDLMKFVDGGPKNLLLARRPDLVDIELTCTNTDKVMPYIDLVIEILEGALSPLVVGPGGFTEAALTLAVANDESARSDIFDLLRQNQYVITERAQVKVSTVSNSEWVIEDDSWRFRVVKPAGGGDSDIVAYAAPQTSEVAGQLDVFPEHHNPGAATLLGSAVFPFQLPLALGREEVDLILKQRGASRDEVLQTFRRGRDASAPVVGVSAVLLDENFSLAFLGLTREERDAIVGDLAIVHKYWGFDEAGDSYTIPRPETPNVQVTGTWIQLLSEVSVFLQRAQLEYAELLELLDLEFVQGATPSISLGAYVEDARECDYNRFQLEGLSAEALHRISFVLRLRKKVGWSFRAIDRYLMLVEQSNFQVPSSLHRIGLVQRLAQAFREDVETLLVLWADLSIRRTNRQPKSLFAELFLRGAPPTGEYQALELLAQGQMDVDLAAASPETSVDGFQAYIRASLHLKPDEIAALWESVIGASMKLTVAHLSQMARVALLCRELKISVVEYFALFDVEGSAGLLGIEVFFPATATPTIDEKIHAIFLGKEGVEQVRDSGIDPGGWDYLLRHVDQPGQSVGPSDEVVAETRRALTRATAEVAEKYPEEEAPDATSVGTLLAELQPEVKVSGVQDLLRKPSLDPADLQYLDDCFTVFLATPGDVTTSPAFVNGDERARAELVIGALRPYLVTLAKQRAATRVASEVTGAPEELAGRLMRSLLSSLSGSSVAIDDWVEGLGGFRTGGTLVNAVENVGSGGSSTTWSTWWMVPEDGDFEFVISVDSTSGVSAGDFTLTVDGDDLEMPALEIANQNTLVRFPVLPGQKAEAVRELSLTYSGPDAITWQVRQGTAIPALLSGDAVSPFDAKALVKLHKALLLANGLRLTGIEIAYLDSLGAPEHAFLDQLPVSSGSPVPWSGIRWFLERLSVQRNVRLDGTTLFDQWRLQKNIDAARVEELGGGKEEDIETLLSELFSSGPGDLNQPGTWLVIAPALILLRRLDVPLSELLALQLDFPPAVRTAETLRNSLRAKYSDESWSSAFKPLRDALRQRHRDALVGHMTSHPVKFGLSERSFVDANDLFAYFLIDVEMEPDTQLSRVKLALNAIQLFVQRVFMGLEEPSALRTLERKKEQWIWMKNYRVWEANRKVFLYPENWIEPELRDDKTELFSTIEDELLQDEITTERAHELLSDYVEGLDEVSNLLIVGSTLEGVFSSGATAVLHIVGRTRSAPYTYYYRTFEGRQFHDGVFTPWKKVPLEISSEHIAPVVVNGALRLFWPVFVEKERSVESGDREVREPIVEIKLMWSSLVPETGRWTKPQLGTEKVVDDNPVSSRQRDPREDGPIERFYHFRTASESSGQVNVEVIKTLDPSLAAAPPVPNRPEVDLEGVDPPPEPPEHSYPGSMWSLEFFNEQQEYEESLEERALQIAERAAEFGIELVEYNQALSLAAAWTPILVPRRLGIFQLSPVGEESLNETRALHALSNNLPRGTALLRNVAVKLNHEVDGQEAGSTFGFRNTTPFFHRLPGPFRSLSTNFGYVGAALDEPFFLETPNVSLFAAHRGPSRSVGFAPQFNQGARFSTFNHPVLSEIKGILRARGTDAIMDRLVQALPTSSGRYYYNYSNNYLSSTSGSYSSGYANRYNYYGGLYLGYYIAGDTMADGVAMRDFEKEYRPDPATVEWQLPRPTVEFSYGTSFGVYNWELFYHLPLLIADRLTQEMRFEEAMEWYHFVFDPRQDLNSYEKTKKWARALPHGARYWNFLPFFANADADRTLQATFGVGEELSSIERAELSTLIAEWRLHPFNPHLIARQRIVAYQKSTVMKYLDNLIAWADQLFRQDTFESINEATQLYVMAAEIMGRRPEIIEAVITEPRHTYRELAARGLTDFSNALVDAESQMVSYTAHLEEDPDEPPPGGDTAKEIALQSLYFRIPRNAKLDSYWDTVADRLFKIRNSMNIDGIKRTLALFAPPIDPALLVRAAAAGADLSSVIAGLNQPMPHYRFRVWNQRAMDLVNEVKSFGGALLSALEKKDAEQLAQLRQGQEVRLLKLVTKVREDQIKEAEENIAALEDSRKLAEDRLRDYSRRDFMNKNEKLVRTLTTTTGALETTAGVLNAVAGVLAIIPETEASPTSVSVRFGGNNLKNSLSGIASAVSAGASVTRTVSANASAKAGYERRREDWRLQERQARLEVDQINQQIVASEVRLAIAQKELENHELQLEQSEEVEAFYKDKFTNQDLYKWMAKELSRTYRQVFNLALDVARLAERTFNFELGTTDATFLSTNYLDGSRQNLLAGEKLGYDIKRMDIAYLERDKREFEIRKPISLASINPFALDDLRKKGECEFALPEVIFDMDHPGQYFRRIRAVSLTIPCVTGPYTSVSAKLSLLGSAIRTQGSAQEDDYGYKGIEDPRFAHNVGGIQSIATSTAQDDAGLFQLDFRDERYLPFEGQGVVSRWKLTLPQAARQFDYHSISDVVVNVSYTARDAGGSLRAAVETYLHDQLNSILSAVVDTNNGTGLARVFSMKREFPDALHQLLSSASKSATIRILPEHFPYLLRDKGYALVHRPPNGGGAGALDAHIVAKGKLGATPKLKLEVVGGTTNSLVEFTNESAPRVRSATIQRDLANDSLIPQWAAEEWSLTVESLNLEEVDDIVFELGYTAEPTL